MLCRILAVVVAIALQCGITTVAAANTGACAAVREQVKVTFYGWPDNDPPGPGIKCEVDHRSTCATSNSNSISNTCAATSSTTNNSTALTTAKRCGPRGETAGGDGSYTSPISMASSGQWFCWQEVVYMPFLRKYARYEDYCQQCIDDARNGSLTAHIDIWTGSNKGGGGRLQMRCEETLTPDGTVEMVRNPGPDLPVDLTDLYLRNGTGRGFCNGTLTQGDTSSNSPPKRGSASITSAANTASLLGVLTILYGLVRLF